MNIPFPENLLPRKILHRIVPFLEPENIILLTGARQTGKTYLLYLIIRYLWKRGLSPFQTAFFDLENIHDFNLINSLKNFNDFWQVLKREGVDPNSRVFVFIDEIQHLDNPSSFLKYLHDHDKPRLKFIVTGSSSLEIKKKFTDRLTGRVYRFVIRPLDFQEFLQFKNEKDLTDVVSSFDFRFWVSSENPEKDFKDLGSDVMARLNHLLDEYLIYGGYPAVALKENPLIRQRDIQEIYSLYIRRDIKDIGEIADVSGYNNLVSLLSLQIGNLVKDQELAVSSGLSRPTVKKYLFLLENTYVLSLVLPFFTNKRTEVIKTPKVYFNDVGMRNGVVNNFVPLHQRTDRGAILENFVYTQLGGDDDLYQNIRFWRSHSKKEVDFIWQGGMEKHYPIEVKLHHGPRQSLPSGLKSFVGAYTPSRAFIVHTGQFNTVDLNQTRIFVIPAWAV